MTAQAKTTRPAKAKTSKKTSDTAKANDPKVGKDSTEAGTDPAKPSPLSEILSDSGEGPKDEGPKDEGPKDEGPKDEGPKDEGDGNENEGEGNGEGEGEGGDSKDKEPLDLTHPHLEYIREYAEKNKGGQSGWSHMLKMSTKDILGVIGDSPSQRATRRKMRAYLKDFR